LLEEFLRQAPQRAGIRGARETIPGRIELGDVITGVDGKPVQVIDELMAILDRHKVGDQVSIELLRDGRRKQVVLTLDAIE
jgi:S1-C subfamily serine protease